MKRKLGLLVGLGIILPFFLSSGYTSAREGGELLQVSAPDNSGRQLLVGLHLPTTGGPFPLALVNHGSPPASTQRTKMNVPSFNQLTAWLVERGYAVALP